MQWSQPAYIREVDGKSRVKVNLNLKMELLNIQFCNQFGFTQVGFSTSRENLILNFLCVILSLLAPFLQVFWHWLVPPNAGAADELFAIPLYFKLNVTSPNPDDWYAFDVEHCTQVNCFPIFLECSSNNSFNLRLRWDHILRGVIIVIPYNTDAIEFRSLEWRPCWAAFDERRSKSRCLRKTDLEFTNALDDWIL